MILAFIKSLLVIGILDLILAKHIEFLLHHTGGLMHGVAVIWKDFRMMYTQVSWFAESSSLISSFFCLKGRILTENNEATKGEFRLFFFRKGYNGHYLEWRLMARIFGERDDYEN